MTKITTGLASAGLVALAFGVVTPGVAVAAPDTPSSPAAGQPIRTSATTPAHISEIKRLDDRRIVLNGVAPGASFIQVDVPEGTGGLTQVVDGRFSLPLDASNLGQAAVLHTFGPGGEADPVPFTIELKDDDGSTVVPSSPVVHAVTQYEPGSFVIEGTVSYDPLVFDRTEVIASVDGRQVRSALDDNGGFALEIPDAHLGAEIELTSWRSGLASEPVPVVGTPTADNTASETFPLDVSSPGSDAVLPENTVTFAGSAIPNSQIVVTRDGSTSRTSATLCETRVAADGDWSCTSSALPGGAHDATVTENPMWASAAVQTAPRSFTVPTVDDQVPALPLLSSVTSDANGDLVVRVVANRAGEARLVVDGDDYRVRGTNGRFTFVLDGGLEGRTATVTGLFGPTEGRSLGVPLTPVEAPAPSPLTAPAVHSVTQQDTRFVIEGTTTYSATEFSVPNVIVQLDGRYVTGASAMYNGAFIVNLPADLAGRDVELITTRGAAMSERTPVTVAATARNTAPETFPLEVTSPAEGDSVAPEAVTVTGEGIPGSIVSLTDDVSRAGEICDADVLADGTWTCTVDAPLAAGEHTLTVTERPYWSSAGTPVSTRSFVVADDKTPAPVAPVTISSPADVSAGYVPNTAFTFEGTARADSTIIVTNTKGIVLAPNVPVDGNGNWAWKRANMSTYTWTIDFTADTGTDLERRARLTGFKPRVDEVAPVTISSPADVSAGYVPNTAFTFEGTARADSTIIVTNTKGIVLAPNVPVDGNGNWAWKRANMSTYTWTIDFTADTGTDLERRARLTGFKPRA